ncbi:cyclin-dependent kinases regulatory subunit [Guillardia theta CCMP2712]|uniref:Cyclin-dependent kinases regulatory subunit n=1 Tax=Guillardia theta (strain CCMP2712) TaxID=905079 RepID=L1IXR3_GUITC|nr:cyclin-dependent kinases regulatory subunit [Guillardia theta CCMP2712]EKX40630.1 cyclin-dependent kinases regulatory subunit [Guillardia theta CCMP2712]|eukprot:XP_005827610.1 cyclin-dependent kinases regulatory subunit [Guillardia theta CCMP2712]
MRLHIEWLRLLMTMFMLLTIVATNHARCILATIQYSEKYTDSTYEYRHVILPQETARMCPKNKLLTETEWRSLGVQQSRGWVHYAIHKPEPHILLFRRPLGTDPVPPVMSWLLR